MILARKPAGMPAASTPLSERTCISLLHSNLVISPDPTIKVS